MNLYKKESFDNLIFNPVDQDPDYLEACVMQRAFDRYMEGIREANPASQRGKMAAYIFLMYDKNCKLREWIPQVSLRKRKAAELAQFDMDSKREASAVEKIWKLEDEGFRKAVINFIRYQNSHLWGLLITNEQFSWELQQSILETHTSYRDDKQKLEAVKIKTQLTEQADKVASNIQRYESILFMEDEELKKAAETFKGNSRPETFASKVLKTPEEVEKLIEDDKYTD